MERIRMLSMGLPIHEIFMDGDLYAIIAREKCINLNLHRCKEIKETTY